MTDWQDIESSDPFLHSIRTRLLHAQARRDQQMAFHSELAAVSALATIWESPEIPADWEPRYTVAAQRGHGGFTLYQDREGRWFRVNSEPLE